MKAASKQILAVTTTIDEVTGQTKPLFAFPVDVVKATSDTKSPFEVAAPSGVKRVQQYVDPITGVVVNDDECPRGVFVGEQFKAIDADAIAEVKAGTKLDTMVVLGSLPLKGVREKYGNRITGFYFLQNPAKGGSAVAYRMVYEALRKDKMAMVTKRTASSKQKLEVIYADDQHGCLAMLEMQFVANMREPDEQITQPVATATVSDKQIAMAREVIGKMADGGHALDAEVDEAVALANELVEKAIAGEAIPTPTPVAQTAQGDDLMAALEASLAS